MKWQLFCCLLIALAVLPSRISRGDLIVDIQDVMLTSGGKGHVDVYVRSTSEDFVQLANYTFVIKQVAGQAAPGVLAFNPIQSFDDQDELNPPYIFSGDTDRAFLTKNLLSPDTLSGFDFTNSGLEVKIDGANRLLTRLELQHEGAGLEGTFTISLVDDDQLSFFRKSNGEDVPIDASSFSNPGLITASISAVPEPATWLLSAGLMTALAVNRRYRRSAATIKL